MPWAESGGPAADLAWAAEHVEIAGAPQQHRTWNLSAIWALPTRDGQVWLKCLPPFCAHEPAVLGLLSDQRVPRVLASEGHRVLLADLPGEDGYLASVEVRRATALPTSSRPESRTGGGRRYCPPPRRS
jgi:hypothetical protein